MANVTQTIPNLTQGISQQPDEYKVPGQVSDMVNALPDVTQGLQKRPAGKFVASLNDGTFNAFDTGKWFHYYRDEGEQYIGQVIRRKNPDGTSHADDGKVRMWNCLTGAEQTIVNAIGNDSYLIHTGDEDIQTLTLNDYTYFNNRNITVEMDSTIEPLNNFGKEVFIELKKIAYAKQYSLNVFDDTSTQTTTTATRIRVDMVRSSNNYCDSNYYMLPHADRGRGVGSGGNTRCGEVAGDGRDAFAPNVGTRIFSINSGEQLVDENAVGGIRLIDASTSPVSTAITNQNYAYTVGIYKRQVGAQYAFSTTTGKYTVQTVDENGSPAAHGLSTGDQLYLDFVSGPGVDETKTIEVVSSNQFRFTPTTALSSDVLFTDNNGGAYNVNYSETNQPDRKNLFFKISTTGQSVPYGSGSNVTYQARYTTTYDLLHGGEGWQLNDYFYVWMKDAFYKITIEEISTSNVQANLVLCRPTPTPFNVQTTITGDSILGDIRTEILNAKDSNGTPYFTASDVTIVGTGLHIKRAGENFNASTPVGELLNVVSGKVNNVGDLPSQCVHGMVVEVVNSDAEQDNHFVKFFGKKRSDGTYMDGQGSWEECAQPGRTIRFKRSTMPIVLIRTADGNFRLTELDGSTYGLASLQTPATFTSTTANNTVTVTQTNHGFIDEDLVNIESNDLTNGQFEITKVDANTFTYESASNEGAHTAVACTIGQASAAPQGDDALVGDDVTNPEPSFVGKQVNKMLFFRNRFCMLSDENIVMSRPGDFTNFWVKSAIQFVAADPIDISASSGYPAVLHDGIQTNTGLVLFSSNQQFMLTTDSDVFSPTTAKINALSTYNFNSATNPISLGTTIGFLDNAGKFSRFFEMASLQREGEPELIEQSAVVSKLFEKDLKLISNSRENSVIFFSSENTTTMYGYRYFDNIRERKLASWFKWDVTGNIKYHCMQDDNLFVVVENNSKHQLLKYAIKMDANTTVISGNRVHLDHLMEIPINIPNSQPTAPTVTYNPTTNKSTFAKPVGLESSNQLVAYDEGTGNNLGRYGLITVNGSNLELDGDWRNETFFIGYQFTMTVDLPTIYVSRLEGEAYRSDTRANTIIHRVKFAFGSVGLYEATLNRTGRNSYTELFEVTNANTYSANTAAIRNDNKLYSVPVYDRNTNVTLTIKSTHPAPANINYMVWEGAYNNNFYTRV